MITICVVVLHLGYASCFDGTSADFDAQYALCAGRETCSAVRDKHDTRRWFFVHKVEVRHGS